MTEEGDPQALLASEAWKSLREWYRTSGRRDLPWRQESCAWEILVAEILLHRTRSTTVGQLFPDLVKKFQRPETVVEKPDTWLEMTRSAGLFWRSELFVDTCRELISRHRGEVPEERDQLLQLSGVGPYIADAVRCFGFGHPTVIVDSNTIRIAVRVSGEDPGDHHHQSAETRSLVSRLGEKGDPLFAPDNYALLDLGGLVCLPRTPQCADCPLGDYCVTGQRMLERS